MWCPFYHTPLYPSSTRRRSVSPARVYEKVPGAFVGREGAALKHEDQRSWSCLVCKANNFGESHTMKQGRRELLLSGVLNPPRTSPRPRLPGQPLLLFPLRFYCFSAYPSALDLSFWSLIGSPLVTFACTSGKKDLDLLPLDFPDSTISPTTTHATGVG